MVPFPLECEPFPYNVSMHLQGLCFDCEGFEFVFKKFSVSFLSLPISHEVGSLDHIYRLFFSFCIWLTHICLDFDAYPQGIEWERGGGLNKIRVVVGGGGS